jgi:hypothetical protein
MSKEDVYIVCYVGLQASLVGLKLGGKISWSWWWVMFPACILAAIIGLIVIVMLLWGMREDGRERRRALMTWEQRLKDAQDKKAARK